MSDQTSCPDCTHWIGGHDALGCRTISCYCSNTPFRISHVITGDTMPRPHDTCSCLHCGRVIVWEPPNGPGQGYWYHQRNGEIPCFPSTTATPYHPGDNH